MLLCLLNPVLHCRSQRVDVDVFQGLELDAIARNTRLAEFFPIGCGQVFPVLYSEDIDRDASRVCADANLIERPGLSIGILLGPGSISDVGVGDRFSVLVFSIQKPQSASWHELQNHAVQRLHVTAF